ncbi:hypothetical protein R69927_03648 [Paraburkholderia domus]|jgi:hypothetical protein|uniref:Uncharacterized protein n=1 Tax=Paraburkholderia domus TaxID=2793075 RepID=A0A9N8MXM4_9BURK|nr:hypothetical protein [Paraburkholderia domus]MBK5053551.1 hypothetical protein [Burkholderia sp. R-70006]MBK5062349.1 hypothetical protein [Burkholderia sp. R-70199]MBK5087911.1 hypothetical protein [Burkholderia sp. R-69927]MBK5120767.1 hypothetical protein [Burkholderia sp. R-69980]MBK5167013.1 hypothetical protein [Burkholderia sp. R-70211]MBK5181457.1 hypothetical protein [Burkholderia sp. R-69749]MCI0146649.1 hypothetical protein [Paraburkholderia sediminicola]
MNLFFWALLNLGVPIVGPIFTLALVAPTHGWRVAKTLIAASVKDGQLFWCSIGLCAAAVYEAMTALERGGGAVPVLESAIAGFCMLAFSCSIIVMSALVNTHHDRASTYIRHRQKRFVTGSLSRVAIGTSILATSVAAILFVILHVRLI